MLTVTMTNCPRQLDSLTHAFNDLQASITKPCRRLTVICNTVRKKSHESVLPVTRPFTSAGTRYAHGPEYDRSRPRYDCAIPGYGSSQAQIYREVEQVTKRSGPSGSTT